MMSKLPQPIVTSRQQRCRCSCAVDFQDPCSACPNKRWGPEFCAPAADRETVTENLEAGAPAFPELGQMARTLATAVGDELKSRVAGTHKIEDEEVMRRFDICKGCQFFDPPSGRCRKCGCFMKWKTAFRSQKCPVGYW